MEKAPRDSSYAKGLLVKHVSYDSNKSFICVYVCFLIYTEKGVWDTHQMVTSAQLWGWEWGGGGKQRLLFISQITCLCSESFTISWSHFYFKNNLKIFNGVYWKEKN